MKYREKKMLAYIVGIALGDGNLSNPNGRAIRLRVTCDARYPTIRDEITHALQSLLPKNQLSIIKRKPTFYDISIYSNKFATWLPWKVGQGSKLVQKAHVPTWVLSKKIFKKECLRGLLQTDGSIYSDRGYTMLNFTNACKPLALDVQMMIVSFGFHPTISTTSHAGKTKHTVRVAKKAEALIKKLALRKL